MKSLMGIAALCVLLAVGCTREAGTGAAGTGATGTGQSTVNRPVDETRTGETTTGPHSTTGRGAGQSGTSTQHRTGTP
jgi:hypothetical protein